LEDTKLIKKITNWKPIGIRTSGRPKIGWRIEAINDLRKIKNCEKVCSSLKIEKFPMILCRKQNTCRDVT